MDLLIGILGFKLPQPTPGFGESPLQVYRLKWLGIVPERAHSEGGSDHLPLLEWRTPVEGRKRTVRELRVGQEPDQRFGEFVGRVPKALPPEQAVAEGGR